MIIFYKVNKMSRAEIWNEVKQYIKDISKLNPKDKWPKVTRDRLLEMYQFIIDIGAERGIMIENKFKPRPASPIPAIAHEQEPTIPPTIGAADGDADGDVDADVEVAYEASKERMSEELTEDELERLVELEEQINDIEVTDDDTFDDLLDIFNQVHEEFSDNHRIVIKFVFEDHNKFYTLSSQFLANLDELIFAEEEQFGSDADVEMIFKNQDYDSIELITYELTDISQRGKFFNFINNSDLDLSMLQIYTKEQLGSINHVQNCLINSLEMLGYADSTLADIKMNMFSDYVCKRDLKKISNMLGKQISVHCLDNNRYYYYGDKTTEKIKIGLFKEHYFPIIGIEINPHALANFLETEPSRYMYDSAGKKRKTTTFSNTVVKKLYKYGCFKRSPLLRKFEQSRYIKPDTSIYLDNIEDDQELFEKKLKKKDRKSSTFFADFETIPTGVHKPFMLGICHQDQYYHAINKSAKEINNNTAFYKCMDWVVKRCKRLDIKEPLVYFHNLRFDFNFIEKHALMIDICKKDSALFSASFRYNDITIELRDSYKMAPFPLSSFGHSFELDICKKDYIPYKFYTEKIIKKRTCDPNVFKEAILKEHGQLPDDLDAYTKRGKLFHMKYMSDYLKLDCQVLQAGLMVYQENMLLITGLDIFDFLTLPSLADYYFIENGAYEDVYEIKGNLLNFVQQAAVGGRCCTKDNQKHIISEPIADVDVNSLYPSAMNRLGEFHGLPSGKAKKIEDHQLNHLDQLKYYIVAIQITAINKYQQIPFIKYTNKNGGCDFTNEVRPDMLVVDKITLEDYIKFHKIEYTVICGVYWEGFNDKISTLIANIYNARVEAKREKNQLKQLSLKLLMNSAYGKCMLKPSKYAYSYTKKDDIHKYIKKNFNEIVEMVEVGQQFRIKKYSNRFSHWNRAHCGTIILSMSKRIMNEVMDCAQDLDIPIYYQDTDSMHLPYFKVDEIVQKYRERYDRELIGKSMGQMHNDLELNGKEAYSEKCIVLGKKCYIDLLKTFCYSHQNQSLDCSCETNCIKTGYHIRMKGVGSKVVLAHKHYGTPEEIYTKLFNGQTLDMNLCLNRVRFKQEKNYIKTIDKFIRKISF